MANWMKNAVKRPGAFTAKANAAGKGVQQYANQVASNSSNYDPRTVKQANLAKTFNKFRPKKKSNSGLRSQIAKKGLA